jgi:hypothetical protein
MYSWVYVTPKIGRQFLLGPLSKNKVGIVMASSLLNDAESFEILTFRQGLSILRARKKEIHWDTTGLAKINKKKS